MPRYEITGSATDHFTLKQIQTALIDAGAVRVKARNAFGWANQPKVATFAAATSDEASRITDAARALLGPGSLPVLLPYRY